MDLSIGIDISKEYFDVCNFDGKKYSYMTYDNTNEGINSLIKELNKSKSKDLLITMEATGVYHLKVAIKLDTKGFSVSVVNPLIIKRYSQMKMRRVKTDKADSKIIAEYGYNEPSYPFIQESEDRQKVELMLKGLEDFILLKNELSNRLEALKNNPYKCKEVEDAINNTICFVIENIKNLENELDNFVKKNFNEEYERLLEIPAVGKRIAALVIGFFGDFDVFENSKQVSSFIGINPSPKESGSSYKGKSNISKKGNGYLRKMFYLAALSASRYNPKCKELYMRLLDKGKLKKEALIAVSNKLIKQIFAVVKYKREFDVNYVEKSREKFKKALDF